MINPEISVSRIMTVQPVTVDAADRLHKVRQIFEQHAFHHIPVTEHNKLVGIISRVDFYKVSHTLSFGLDGQENEELAFHPFTARDIMTGYPMHLESTDTVGLAADIIMANRFHALPVVDNDELVGILTSHDLIAFAYGPSILEEMEVEHLMDVF